VACLTPRSPTILEPEAADGTIKPILEGRPPKGEGVEGGRSTGSTEDSGPAKPGNRVEEKTLKTGKQGNKEVGCRNVAMEAGLRAMTKDMENVGQKGRRNEPATKESWGRGGKDSPCQKTRPPDPKARAPYHHPPLDEWQAWKPGRLGPFGNRQSKGGRPWTKGEDDDVREPIQRMGASKGPASQLGMTSSSRTPNRQDRGGHQSSGSRSFGPSLSRQSLMEEVTEGAK
jgi:hypothetical protein